MLTFSTDFTKVAAAMLAVQREVQPIVKDRANDLLRSKYATLDATMDYLRPLLAQHDLIVLQSVSPVEGRSILVETTALHVSGEWVRNAVLIPLSDGNKGTSPQQAAGSTITYGRRYGLSALFALTTGEDDDGNGGGRGESRQRREARVASRTSAHLNGNGIVAAEDIPFPRLKNLELYHGKPMREVPQGMLEEGYRRTKDRPEKNAQGFAKAMEVELERRRGLGDFEALHPALIGEV
jgi:hypothetical protein